MQQSGRQQLSHVESDKTVQLAATVGIHKHPTFWDEVHISIGCPIAIFRTLALKRLHP
jgi:hypothetical protein